MKDFKHRSTKTVVCHYSDNKIEPCVPSGFFSFSRRTVKKENGRFTFQNATEWLWEPPMTTKMMEVLP